MSNEFSFLRLTTPRQRKGRFSNIKHSRYCFRQPGKAGHSLASTGTTSIDMTGLSWVPRLFHVLRGDSTAELRAEAGKGPARSEAVLSLSTVVGKINVCGDRKVNAVNEASKRIKTDVAQYLKDKGVTDEGAKKLVADGVAHAATKLAAWGIAYEQHPGDESATVTTGKFARKVRKAAKARKAALESEEVKDVTNIGVSTAIGAVDEYLISAVPEWSEVRAMRAAAEV